MAIDFRILAPLTFCLSLAGAEAITCGEGETITRENLTLAVEGDAALSVRGPCTVRLRNLKISGRRETQPQSQPLPPYDRRFLGYYAGNGIVLDGVVSAEIEDVELRWIAGFAVLAAGARNVVLRRVTVRDSGSLGAKGQNNTTGGVLLEDGTGPFLVEHSVFENITGNAVWTHSRYQHVRNGPGRIRESRFREIGRDAIQVGHAFDVEVSANQLDRIGYPVAIVDVEGGGTPVGIDTAGNVEGARYTGNRMEEINGKCIDLDGFHHGEVTGNTCVNRGPLASYPFGHFGIVMNNTNPDMQSVRIRIRNNRLEGMRFGGIFVIGSGHEVTRNVLRNLQMAHCSSEGAVPGCTHFPGEPDLLRAGIYLGRRAERPAITRGNRVTENAVEGWRMDKLCIGFAPTVQPDDNVIRGNRCRHQDSGPTRR